MVMVDDVVDDDVAVGIKKECRSLYASALS